MKLSISTLSSLLLTRKLLGEQHVSREVSTRPLEKPIKIRKLTELIIKLSGLAKSTATRTFQRRESY